MLKELTGDEVPITQHADVMQQSFIVNPYLPRIYTILTYIAINTNSEAYQKLCLRFSIIF